MTVLEQLPERARVCVIRLRSLGDCVLTTPALGLLKATRPDVEVGVVVEDRFRPVFEEQPAVSRIIAPRWQDVRAWHSTLCLNLHGGTRSQWMTALSGAKWRVGFSHHTMTWAYNFRVRRAQQILGVRRTVHTAEHLASSMFALGVPLQPVPRARLGAGTFPLDGPRQGKYAVLHPFASAPEKRWSADRFCELARYLKLWNVEPVFLASSLDDATPFRAHKVQQGTLNEAKALLSRATVFIGNDSGPAHMAAAFGVPSVVMFSTSNPAIWGPWRTESEIVVALDGLDKVSVSRVIAAVERLRTLEEAHA